MKNNLLRLSAAVALLAASALAGAQTVPTTVANGAAANQTATGTSAATIAPGAVTVNSIGAPQLPVTTTNVNYAGQPAAGIGATVIAPNPVQNTCDEGGFGIGGNNKSGSAILSFPGGTEIGCDMVRDVNTINFVEKMPEGSMAQKAALARICKKKEIAASYADAGEAQRCATAAQKAQAKLNGQPISAVMPEVPTGTSPVDIAEWNKQQRISADSSARYAAGQPVPVVNSYANR